jgi:nucleoside-diphosphate-sugar epimerase
MLHSCVVPKMGCANHFAMDALSGDLKNAHLKQLDGARANLHLFQADVLDYDALTRAVEGCEGLFHLATPVPDDKVVYPQASSYSFI